MGTRHPPRERRAHDLVEVAGPRRPAEHLGRLLRGRQQRRRVTGAARSHLGVRIGLLPVAYRAELVFDALHLLERRSPALAPIFLALIRESMQASAYLTIAEMERHPALEKLDSLIYKTVGTAFAGLAILLVTGAVWANESWGRYWGWDAKETGALVAWLAYAGYLHTRIAHNWTGRRSAYFALVGFLLVIFTYLGVSYLLPGLHSYA